MQYARQFGPTVQFPTEPKTIKASTFPTTPRTFTTSKSTTVSGPREALEKETLDVSGKFCTVISSTDLQKLMPIQPPPLRFVCTFPWRQVNIWSTILVVLALTAQNLYVNRINDPPSVYKKLLKKTWIKFSRKILNLKENNT